MPEVSWNWCSAWKTYWKSTFLWIYL